MRLRISSTGVIKDGSDVVMFTLPACSHGAYRSYRPRAHRGSVQSQSGSHLKLMAILAG